MMKKILLLPAFLLVTAAVFAQGESAPEPPYKRFPSYPPVKLMLPDSVSYYSKEDLPKKSPVMLMLFSPDCDHCQHETEQIIQNIDKFKGIQIVMTTMQPFDSMMAFRERNQLARFSNIVVAHDNKIFTPTFFNIRSLPFLAFYNRKKELISVFEGTMKVEKMLEELKK